MECEIKYQGKVASREDIKFIRELISKNPNDSRRELSKKLCRAWNWVQPNGKLRDMVCRGFMLKLHSSGYIELPHRKRTPNNPLANRKNPPPVEIAQTTIDGPLSSLQPIEIQQVRLTPNEKLFNGLIARYHYLGYCHPVGEHLKYIVYGLGRPIACFSWSSAPRHLGSRDRFIGWSPEDRRKNIHLVAYNSRFIILPWIRCAHLGSHLLARMAKVLPRDWEKIYNHPICFLETFVDTEIFKGTVYQAANWIYLGKTTGRGKNDHTNKPNRSIKAVWGYPLSKNFREALQRG
jgi:hypothetical protein